MPKKTRRFGTHGRLYPEDNYLIPRTTEVADFIRRVKEGKYIVLFAPRQTGKTTFFQLALEELAATDPTYFRIQLNFEVYDGCTAAEFYEGLAEDLHEKIVDVFQERGKPLPETFAEFLENMQLTNQLSLRRFFRQLAGFLGDQRVILIIDEFDAIPRDAVKGFLRVLRDIYLSGKVRCPQNVGIVGVKSITQLDYDRSISPFNIQDEFHLPNFTLEQVRDLLTQYTDEVGQAFAPEVTKSLHRQTAGQPFLVNRFAQTLTEEMDIPKNETITMEHFAAAHKHLTHERNTNIEHLVTNIRKDRGFEALLMRIASYEQAPTFNPYNELMNELATYGVITKGADGRCEILNPIYHYCITQAFQPAVNGLETDYFRNSDRAGFQDYLTPDGHIQMAALLDNFRGFIARAGFKILQVPETPQEYVGQYLLFTYLDQFVQSVDGIMYLEVQTGRGRMDLVIFHKGLDKYIVETKIWEGPRYYRAGKKQLAAYMKLEGVAAGYYVVFDHRQNPEAQVETETIDGVQIRSYVIPVMQKPPSSA